MVHTATQPFGHGAILVAQVYAPESSVHVSKAGDTEIVRSRLVVGPWLHALYVRAESTRGIHVFMVSYEEPGSAVCGDEVVACIDALIDEMGARILEPGVSEFLARTVESKGWLLHAAWLSVPSGPIVDGYVEASFVGSGMPPLVLLEKGHYHFPARSGIPAGTASLDARMQSMDIPCGSTLYLHTCLSGPANQLRQLHASLPSFAEAALPANTIVFSLSVRLMPSHEGT